MALRISTGEPPLLSGQNYSRSGKLIPGIDFCQFSEHLLILLRDGPCLEFNYRFHLFSGFALLAGQITGSSLETVNSSKRVFIGPAQRESIQ